MFRRTLLYAGPPARPAGTTLRPGENVGARAIVYLRRRDGVRGRAFRKFIKKELVPALIATGVLKELRTQAFLPWNEKMWDTPNVAHDNPADQRFHASVDPRLHRRGRPDTFFEDTRPRASSPMLAPVASAIHAYDVSAALTYVWDGDPPPLPGVRARDDFSCLSHARP